MKVNSFKVFRELFKQKRPNLRLDCYQPDFIGTSHKETFGFFSMYHGQKNDISGFLQADLNMAEDDQAIYEFLQNAVDCKATLFSTYYNQTSFFVLNNGSQFDENGIVSILNIGQSTKHDAKSIGRLGVGFKLAHRLVGKQNGLAELLNDYKGPIVFSWNNFKQLKSFLSEEKIEVSNDWKKDSAHLFKILITNFPIGVEEEVYDLKFKRRVLFSEDELDEMRDFIRESLGNIEDQAELYNQGSITYLRLGEGKSERLDNCKDNLIDGVQYSMNLFDTLTNITLNGECIEKKDLVLESSIIEKETEEFIEIDPEYKDFDIQYTFGFPAIKDWSDSGLTDLDRLIDSPNFYKYFPMGEEINYYGLFVHCDSFSVQSNRRELNEGVTNENLLPIIADFICAKLVSYRKKSPKKFKQLYTSLLLSNPRKCWVKDRFWDTINYCIKKNIPIEDGGYCDDSDHVKIKMISTAVNLEDIGLGHIRWFLWDDAENNRICQEAVKKEKLDLYRWDINDIIEEADIDSLAKWLRTTSIDTYNDFFNELSHVGPKKDTIRILRNLPIYIIGKKRISWDEIEESDNNVVLTDSIIGVSDILHKLGYNTTSDTISNHILYEYISEMVQEDKWLFEDIRDNRDLSKLDAKEKLRLISSFVDDFVNIGPETIKKLKIFKNQVGELKPMNEMLPYNSSFPEWMQPYMIHKDEYDSELDKYLVTSDTVFPEIISKQYHEILDSGLSPFELYNYFSDIWTPSMTQNFLTAYGVTEDTFLIVENERNVSSVRMLINKMNPEIYKLYSNSTYDEKSFIYRLISIVVSISDEPSTELLRKKLYLNDEPLTSYSAKNEIRINLDDRYYDLLLSDLIPGNSQPLNFSSIAEKFSDIIGYRDIFSSDKTNLDAIDTDLYNCLNQTTDSINPSQYAFFMLYSNKKKYNGFEARVRDCIRISSEKDILSTLDFFYKKKWGDLLKDNINNDSPNNCISTILGKYLFSSKYTLKEEQAPKYIEEWCGNDSEKLSFLKGIGMISCDGDEIRRRTKFHENELEDWGSEIKYKPTSFLNWVKSIAPITGDKQIEVLRNLSKKNFVSIEQNEEDYVDAKEWDDSLYLKWKSSESTSKCKVIKLMQGAMPCRFLINGEMVAKDFDKQHPDFWFNNQILYINSDYESDIDGVLSEVQKWNSSVISREDRYAMFYIDRKEYEDLRRQNDQLKYEKEQLLVEGHGEKRTRGKQSKEERINQNREARKAAYDYLSSLPDYDCSEWEPEESSHLINCVKYHGEYIKIAVISSGAGTIHIHPFVFAELMENPDNLLLNYVKGKIYRRSYKSLFEENPDVNIIFDTDIVNNPAVIAKIVNILRGSARTCFAIANRDYSAYDAIQGFGLNEKKEGEFQNYSLNDDSMFDWED